MKIIERADSFIRIGKYWIGIYEARIRIVPIIQGGTAVNFVQNDKYAFGDDDGSESGHTLDSENTDRSAQTADVTFMIRIQCEETAGGNATYTHALFAQKNGSGGFTEVTTARSDGLIIADDTQSRADDENTTERLSYSGGGAFQAGKYDDGQTQQGTTSFKCDTEYTELEFAIQIDSGNASDSDYWELRCEQANGTDYNGYPGSYPTVTASISAGPLQRSISDAVGVTDTVTTARELFKTITDAVGITDTLTTARALAKTIADAVGVTDTIASVVKKVVSIADDVGVTDALTTARAIAKTIADDVGVTDTLTTARAIAKTLSDAVGVTDALTNARALAISIANAVGVTDTLGAALKKFVTIADDVGVTDTISNILTAIVNKDIQIVYDISNLVNKSLQVVYDIRELVNKSLSLKWDILGEGGAAVAGAVRDMRTHIGLRLRRL